MGKATTMEVRIARPDVPRSCIRSRESIPQHGHSYRRTYGEPLAVQHNTRWSVSQVVPNYAILAIGGRNELGFRLTSTIFLLA